jgi:hypothetical protein
MSAPRDNNRCPGRERSGVNGGTSGRRKNAMQDNFAMSRPGTGRAMRHLTLAFLAFGIGVIGLSPGARAADTLKVGKAIAVGFTFVPLDVGMRTSIFKKYGLQIEESAFRGDAKLTLNSPGAVYSLRAGVTDGKGSGAIASAMLVVTDHGHEVIWPAREQS